MPCRIENGCRKLAGFLLPWIAELSINGHIPFEIKIGRHRYRIIDTIMAFSEGQRVG